MSEVNSLSYSTRERKRRVGNPRLVAIFLSILLIFCLFLFCVPSSPNEPGTPPFTNGPEKEASLTTPLGYVSNESIHRVTITLNYSGPPQKSLNEWSRDLGLSLNESKTHQCFLSQHGEDFVLFQRYLSQVREGYFVEIGGLNGFSLSTTLFFERRMNWTGILIEASPMNTAEFRKHYTHLRPRAEFINSAVCYNESILNYVTNLVCIPCSGILDFAPSSLNSFYKRMCVSTDNVTAGNDANTLRRLLGQPHCLLSPVSCVRMDTLLRRRDVWKVDLFVLDVEGGELEVLRTVDLARGPPIHFFVVELDGKAERKDREVRRVLRAAGYVPRGRVELSELWQRADFGAALRAYVRRRCAERGGGTAGTPCGAESDTALYGPDATAALHRQRTADCFAGNALPESYFLDTQWAPPFHTVREAL